jgi:hypothetical protein
VPDFYPAIIHHQNPGPGGTTIRKGGATYLDLIVHTTGGFAGPFTITAEGLPKGVHMAPTTLQNESRGVIVFWADADAADVVGPVRLTATAKRGDETITREVRPYSRVWNSTDLNSSRPTRELVLAVREAAPFAVTPAEQATVEAGKKVEVKVACARLWPEFKGAVTLTPLSFPGPIKMGTMSVAEGKNDATITIEAQPNTRPGEYTLTLQGQAQVPFAKDPKATTRPNTLVSLPSRPITLVVTAAVKK